jgi:hypothetical protein
LYALLINASAERRTRGIVVIPCEELRGAPAFQELKLDPPTTEVEFRLLWLAYFLSLIARTLAEEQLESADAKLVIRRLADLGLVEEPFSISGLFRKAASFARRVRVDPQVTIQETGSTTFSGKVRVDDSEIAPSGGAPLLELFAAADRALEEAGLSVWLALDRLDVAFADEPALELNALRSLFQTYRSLEGFSQVALKVFLRSDIWNRLTRQSFREASHITREKSLRWSPDTLLNLVVRRAAENIPVLDFYGLDKEGLLESFQEQRSLCCDRLLEPLSAPTGTVPAFDWLMTVLRDGTGRVSPRDLIHFLTNAREMQLNEFELGGSGPGSEYLIGQSVYREAFHDVAVFRLQRSFYAEYPKLRPYVEGALEGKSSVLTLDALRGIWDTDPVTATEVSGLLAELGVLERVQPSEQIEFYLPPLTRWGLTPGNGM